MQSPDFNIKVIADVTCDIAPVRFRPFARQLFPIRFFGFDPILQTEIEPFQENA
jgi:hypothetical protein